MPITREIFYSPTLLGRKGPLATVWQAATIQRNVKKSHYDSTHIPSTVDLIIRPSIPFALRQSAYLLLGVVRIHSKQVEYLLQKCKTLETGIRKAFLSTNVNLREDITHAPYRSITFDLDALDLNDDLDLNRLEDPHLKSRGEITLEDQILTHEDQHVAIYIDEDIENSLSTFGEFSGLGVMSIETDSDPSNIDGIPSQSQNSSPTNQASLNGGTVHDHISQYIPEIEMIRNVVHDHDSGTVPLWTDQWNDVMEPDHVLEALIMKDKETTSLVVEEMMERNEPLTATLSEVQEFTNTQISFGQQSPDLVLQSTPPPEVSRARKRRRQLLIDDAVKLSDDEIRGLLVDASALKRQRKIAHSSSLNIWELNNRRRKDGMLFEPFIIGLCDDLCNIYKEEFVSAKIKMASSQEEDHAEPSGNHSPPPGNDFGVEIESQHDNPSRRDCFTPSTWYREGLGVENTDVPDIPEFDSSVGDLSFLDQDDRTPTGEQGRTLEFGALPGSTRAVALFLHGKSPITSISEDTGDLNLNTILEGKNKKICARMFFETLVLNNRGFVKVNQNEPYGDVTLKVTSKLKKQFSS